MVYYSGSVDACVVLKPGAVFDEEKVREQLTGKLAKYKIPSRFFAFDEFQMLDGGKIDGVTLKKEVLSRLPKEQEKNGK